MVPINQVTWKTAIKAQVT